MLPIDMSLLAGWLPQQRWFGGKGAAIGAATGALIGGIRRRNQVEREAQQQHSYQQQQAAAQANQGSANVAQRDQYNRATTACLQGRGYTVN